MYYKLSVLSIKLILLQIALIFFLLAIPEHTSEYYLLRVVIVSYIFFLSVISIGHLLYFRKSILYTHSISKMQSLFNIGIYNLLTWLPLLLAVLINVYIPLCFLIILLVWNVMQFHIKINSTILFVFIMSTCYIVIFIYAHMHIDLISNVQKNIINSIILQNTHDTFIHLFLNIATLAYIVRLMSKTMTIKRIVSLYMLSLFLISVIYQLVNTTQIHIGASGIIISLLVYETLKNHKNNIQIIITIVDIIAITFIVPNISILLHISGIVIGMLLYVANIILYNNDKYFVR